MNPMKSGNKAILKPVINFTYTSPLNQAHQK